MKPLKTPLSGYISHIIHISDLHIRVGDQEKSRYNDYLVVIQNLENMISLIPAVQQHSAVVVFTGDMFEFKNRLDSYSVLLFNTFIDSITKYQLPLYIICGNHDLVQSSLDIPDVITSLLYRHNNDYVCYLNHTGHYIANNLGLGLVDIKDTLKKNSGSGHVEQLPPFPDADLFPPSVTTKIALFHGSFQGAIFSSNKVYTGGMNINWIRDAHYDCAMLGDVHMVQLNPTSDWSSQFIWCYAGSLLQLNFGENLEGHGFLLWDINTKKVTLNEVPCPTKFINLSMDNGCLVCHLGSKQKTPIAQILSNLPKSPILPKSHVQLKLKGDILPQQLDELKKQLNQNQITYSIIQGLVLASPLPKSEIVAIDNHMDISHYNTVDAWIQHITQCDQHNVLEQCNWRDWLINPASLLLSSMDLQFNDPSSDINKRDKELRLIVNKLEDNRSQFQSFVKQKFVIHNMNWDFILCYGKGNYFSFDTSINKISIVSGPNSVGKSSFLEILLIGLYGNDIPSRRDKDGLSSIICRKKPPQETPQITIVFSIGDEYYCIKRLFVQSDNLSKTVTLSQISSLSYTSQHPQVIRQISSSIQYINKWVETHIGQFEHFIMSCLITQSSDNDFFTLKDTEQIKLLDDVLHVHTIEDMSNFIKAVILSLEYLDKLCTSLRASCTHKNPNPIEHQQLIKDKSVMEQDMGQLEQLQNQYKNIKETWHHLSESDLCLSFEEIDTNINHFQKRINKTKDQNQEIDLKQLEIDKALLQEKLNNRIITDTIDTEITIEDAQVRLLCLNQNLIQPPQCSVEYYNQQLEMIDDCCPNLTQEQICTEMDKCQQALRTNTEQLQFLVQNKPERPTMTREDLGRSKTELDREIANLDDIFNSPQKLKIYCEEHPIITIDATPESLHQMKQSLNQMKQSLQQDQKQIKNQVLLDTVKYDDIQFKQEITNKEAQQSDLTVSIEQTMDQINNNDCQIKDQSLIIDQINHQLNTMIDIRRPSLTLEEITQWLQQYQQHQADIYIKEDCLQYHQSALNYHMNNEALMERIQILQKELDDLCQQNIPFNPNCEACCQQPWKLHELHVKSQIEQLTQQKKRMLTDDELTQHQHHVTLLTTWINDYHIEQGKYQYYIELQEDWVKYDQQNVIITQLQETKTKSQNVIDELKHTTQQLQIQYKSLTLERDELHQLINDMIYLSRYQSQWEHTRQQIIQMEQSIADCKLHYLLEQYMYYVQQEKLIDEYEKWNTRYGAITYDNTQLKDKIQYLEEQELINQRYAINLQNETIYRKQLHIWEQYNNQQKQISELNYVIYYHQLITIDKQITRLHKYMYYNDQINYWKDIKYNKPICEHKRQLSEQISELCQNVNQSTLKYGRTKQQYDDYVKYQYEINMYDQVLVKLKARLTQLRFIHITLTNYRIWLYQHVVIPQIVNTINVLVSTTTQSKDYTLDAKVSVDRFNKITINWVTKGPSGTSSLQRSGGFRRFHYGLMMRVALSRMGCSRVNNYQLFIDEGFTASDAANLEKIPQFLHQLLDIYPHGIILVSHLQDIRDCADIVIDINFNPDMTSMINFNPSKSKIQLKIKTQN